MVNGFHCSNGRFPSPRDSGEAPRGFVITSYSIHYTKLYDPSFPAAPFVHEAVFAPASGQATTLAFPATVV